MTPRRLLQFAALCGSAFALTSCASVGPTRPPSLAIPVRIADLNVVERGDRLAIDYTAPAVSTDNVALRRIRETDLRAGPPGPNWETTARRIQTPPPEPGPVHFDVPVAEWNGQEILVRVRTSGKHGRFSAWSNEVRLKILPPLAKPALKIEAVSDGVRLDWTAQSAAAQHRIFRKGPADQQPTLIATVKTPEYIDRQTDYGKKYDYAVQAFTPSGDSEAQSELSQVQSITPEDRFPPAVPSGVAATAGISTVQLAWTPDTEPDLRGYYVYRSSGSGPLVRLGELVTAPAYVDRTAESAKPYRYAVSAVDQAGNESRQSAPVEVVAP